MRDAKLEKLMARKAALAAEQAAATAKLRAVEAKISQRERKDETRRKILLGSYLLAKIKQDEKAKAAMLKELSVYLIREDDRKLFGLLPLPPEKPALPPLEPAKRESPAPVVPMRDDAPLSAAH